MLGTRSDWTPGGLLRQTGLELIAHGQAEAGHKTLARAISWYKALPSPEKERLRGSLALSLLAASRVDEAITLFEIIDQEDPDQFLVLGALGVARALKGDRADAERISARLEGMNIPFSFGDLSAWQAQIAASLGNKEQAIVFVRRAFSEGKVQDGWIHTRPAFQTLLDFPPFQILLQPQEGQVPLYTSASGP